jgi:hypothetical protein
MIDVAVSCYRMYLQEQKQLEAEKLANKRQQDLDGAPSSRLGGERH